MAPLRRIASWVRFLSRYGSSIMVEHLLEDERMSMDRQYIGAVRRLWTELLTCVL
jgi:hypothetical protein